MRIYLICKRYYTNKDLINDCFGRLYHLPVELVKNGADVWVDAIDYRNKNIDKLIKEGVFFRTTPVSLLKFPTLPFALFHHCYVEKPDIIIASGDSHIGFMAAIIAKILNIPFVFDVYDYYPAFRGNSIPGMKTMFRYATRKANLVLCTSKSLMQTLVPLNSNQLLIENGVDTKFFAPADMFHARKQLGLSPEAQLVGYFGSIDPSRGPLLIDACRRLRLEFSALQLVMAGRVSGVSLEEPWIVYRGELPQSEIPTMINACDLVAIPYADTPFNSMCGACKIAEYLACNKPVVATRVSDHACMFTDAPLSICEPTPESMAEALRYQLLNKDRIKFPKSFSWDAIGLKLYASLQSLSSS